MDLIACLVKKLEGRNPARNHMVRLSDLRGDLSKKEETRSLRIRATGRLRPVDQIVYEGGHQIDIYDMGAKIWIGGFAVVGKINSHLLAGESLGVSKQPTQRGRPKFVYGLVSGRQQRDIDANDTLSPNGP